MANHVQGVIYLLHFDRPYRHTSHYTGWVHSPTFLQPRLGAHRDGVGARLMQVVGEAGPRPRPPRWAQVELSAGW